MSRAERPGIRLQVARARPQDIGQGAARLGPDAMLRLGVREGDAVEIIGKRHTAAVALRLPFEDRGLELLRLDGLQRANAGVSIGDYTEVCRARESPARHVALAASRKHLEATGSAEALRRTLLKRVVTTDDIVSTSTSRGGAVAADPDTLSPDAARVFLDQPAFGLQEMRFRVASTIPAGVVRIVETTQIELLPDESGAASTRRADVTYDDLGGLGDAITQVREMIELPLKHPELFQRLGIDPPKGVLLHGPSGTGKTLLARAVASEADARFFYIGGPEIMGPYQGESEQRLRDIFQQAREHSPAIVFIDEIDSIAAKREAARGETERRLVAQLLTLLDGLEPRRNVIVIGATNLPDTLDEALRRPGRFDREIAVGVPDREGRREILAIHTRAMPLAADVDLDELARTTSGFVGADIAALAREAAIDALRRSLKRVDLETSQSPLPAELLERLEVTREDFVGAQRRVQPSALRELVIHVPDARWDDIGGLEDAKSALREGIELPLRNPDGFRRLGVRASRGFLLFGPPGTGKTLLAKAAAHEAEANFIAAKSSDLLSKWYGESERQISRLFARARQVAPTVIFLDEIDGLAPQRGGAIGEPGTTERIVNTLLTEMDGLEGLDGVVVIGATNRPTLLDPALLRPGRFDELIYVPVPDHRGRLHILRVHTARVPLAEDVRLEGLADRTHGYTGADLEALVRRAALHALRDHPDVDRVPASCFERALEESRASVTAEMEREYEELLDELKRESPRGRRKIGFLAGEEPAARGDGRCAEPRPEIGLPFEQTPPARGD